jgi:transposase
LCENAFYKGVFEIAPQPSMWEELTAKERQTLRSWCFGLRVERRLWIRGSIVRGIFYLGLAPQAVAAHVGVAVRTVYTWCTRFQSEGIAGLYDRPRSGAPPRFTVEQRCEVIAIACERPEAHGFSGEPRWTCTTLTWAVNQAAEDFEMSRSSVWRTLKRNRLQPHRLHSWQHSRDPQFKARVNTVVDWYLRPCEDGVVVLSVDEKTGIQANERKHPTCPARPGRPGRYEHEYIRHGTQALLAAFNIHTGKVTAECGPTRQAADLLALMEKVAHQYQDARRIIVIWDNLNTHVDGPPKRWTHFNARHGGKFEFVYTPKHASWVNQIEIFFSIMTRRCLKYSDFTSTDDLAEKLRAFIARWNTEEGHPFDWTFAGYPMQEKEAA